MKMFLTRLGFGSKAVITGDITQIDLPDGKQSGLREALRVLDGVEGIAQCFLTEKDVVRHELVQRIVKAYAEYENKKGKGKPAHGPNRTAAPAGRQPSPGARFAPHSAPGHKLKKNQQKENTSWKTGTKKK